MEITSIRQLLPHVGEEKYQMLELNRRLESYLGRVKLLEEENQLLRGEIQALRRKGNTKGQKQIQEEALHQARREVQAAWMEKDRVEMDVSNLIEEMEALNAQRQKEKAAQAEAKRKLAESKMKLEDERRTQIWLREQAAHLEKEVTLQVQVHEEEMKSLKSTTVLTKSVLVAPQSKQTFSLRELGDDYSQRAAQAWQEAASVYQRQVEQLEDSLNQTKVGMTQINQEKRENQLYLQDLSKEMESSKAKRELLEKNMEQQRNRQSQELQKLQTQVECLEAEKVDIREQIGDLLIDRRNLLQMKMCLGLEVATYRALLDSESLRVNSPSPIKSSTQTVSFLEALPKPHRTPSGTQATSVSSHFNSPLTTTSRSITPSKSDLMTHVLSRSLTQSSQETHKRVPMSEREKTGLSEDATKFEKRSASTSIRGFSGTGFVPLTSDDALEKSYSTTISTPVVHSDLDGPGSILSSHVEEDLEEMPIGNQSKAVPDTSGTEEEAALISQLPAGNLSSIPQTPEREVSCDRHAEDTRGSDEGEDEETEVSTEMARISHAPMFSWEENDKVVPKEKNIVSELELESQTVSVNYAQQWSVEATIADLQQLDENSEDLASPSLEEMSLHSIDAIILGEKNDQSDILALVGSTESVTNVPEEESFKSEPEMKNETIESYEIIDSMTETPKDEVQFENCGNDMQESHHSVIELQDEGNRSNCETEENVEERKEEKVTVGHEEEKDIDKVEEDIVDLLNKSIPNTGKQVIVKDSLDPETEVYLHESSAQELAQHTDELLVDTSNKDYMPEEVYPEEDKMQSDEDEESLNISASWRTDPGDGDTLADTRPLIHYKSDDEADANTQASHFGVSEPSDSEDEREKHEGSLMWGQTAAKRFDTMEDLSEEPEIITSDDVVVEESAQTRVEEKFNGEFNELVDDEDLQSKSEDQDMNINTLKEDNLMDLAVNDLISESTEDVGFNMEEKSEGEINQVQKQDLYPESFLSETREINKHPSTGEDDTAISQTVVDENIGEIPNEELIQPVDEDDLQSINDELDISVNTLKDDTLMDVAINDFRTCEYSSKGIDQSIEDKSEEEIISVQNTLIQKQDEISFTTHSQDLSLEDFISETRDNNYQLSIGEDGSAIAQSVVEENIDEILNEESVQLVDDDALQSKSNLQYWSQSFLTETRHITEQPSIGEDDTTYAQSIVEDNYDELPIKEHLESVDNEDLQIKGHSQDWSQSFFTQEETLEEEPCKMALEPTDTSHSEVFPLETNLSKGKTYVKEEEDEQSNISMLTHADFTDNLSLHSGPSSRPDSQTNVEHSDLDESNSSDDESPNASQCSQLPRHSGVSTEEQDSSNAANFSVASKDQDSVSLTGSIEDAKVKSFGEDCFADNSTAQAVVELENVSQNQEEHEVHQRGVENSGKVMNKDANGLPQMQACESLDLDNPDNITRPSHDILETAEDLNDLEEDKASDKLDIFQDNVLNKEPQEPKEKENDPHSFFSSSIKEDIWNMAKFEMAATYDSHDHTETERYSSDTIHPNQSMAFGEKWGEIGSLKPANGKPEKEISTGHSDEEEEIEEGKEDQDTPKAKELHHKDAKAGVAERVQSDDSIEEGDSWSSGEE